MCINTTNTMPFKTEGQDIEEVERFTYLGSEVSKEGGAEVNIRRTRQARAAFHRLNKVWNNTNIFTKLSNIVSVLLYGWRMTKEAEKKLDVLLHS